MTLTLYTVGHGNRQIGELIALLKEAGVDTLVDVRAQPRSRHNPQFNDDALRLACEHAGIVYHWAGKQLGGMRDPRPESPHRALPEGLRGFADHMDTDAFQKGAAQLRNLADRGTCAILCAERDPAHCHRSLIADYLTLQGARVIHLIAPGEMREHALSPAVRRESAALVYDRQVNGELGL
ncbi:DNA repair protein [Sulfuricaulis limicola]|uniref:DNA repair protein n=1 Tax=Sulfuricaulis limicola TaxID=1620215 RepID=A0A1B4XFP8_9GAMM|nr:DUF488 domain-containing protein [Sulfuricaulis limicola]BAV33623.1 DNA repair protein [Sulfuricaulis limicola]